MKLPRWPITGRLCPALRIDSLVMAVLAAVFFVVFGGLLLVKTPPFAVPDEPFHWKRALQISQGGFLARNLGPNSWGGPIDRAGFHYMLHYMDLIHRHAPVDAARARALSDALDAQPRTRETVAFPSSASFAPLAYLPQGAFVAVARAVGLSPADQVHAGRLGNLVVYGLMLVAIVWALPGGRAAFLALALSPVAMQSAASFSADPLNLTLPALMLALCWRWRERATPLGRREKAGLLGLSAGLGLLKLTMAPFAGVVLYLPGAVLGGLRPRLRFAALCLGVAVGIALLWNLIYPFVPGPYWGTAADPGAQVAWTRAHPAEALDIFVSTVRDWGFLWWYQGYACYGGHPPPWSGCAGPTWIMPAFWILLALALADGARRRDPVVAAGFLLPVPAYGFLILAAFWVGFTPVANATVDGIQGRYFHPMYALVLLALAAAAGPWRPEVLRRGVRLALFAAALALHGMVLAEILGAWDKLWV